MAPPHGTAFRSGRLKKTPRKACEAFPGRIVRDERGPDIDARGAGCKPPSTRRPPWPISRILDWREMRRGSLLGFARVEFPSGLIISDVTILQGEAGAWASPPSKPMIGRDGVVMKDSVGKVKYSPIIEFASKEIRNRWSDAVIAAMKVAHPEVFS